MQRVDPDAIVARVGVDAVIGRVDLAELAREVLAAIDLPEILRSRRAPCRRRLLAPSGPRG
jgi:hypothetical protein